MMKWHVFPQGPMCSIRRALMLWLVPVFLVVGATAAGLGYWSYCAMVSGFLDDQMVQIANAAAGSEEARLPRQTTDRVEHWGAFVVQTFDRQGQLVSTTYPELAAPMPQGEGFQDVEVAGHGWRAYALPPTAPGNHTVQVLQSASFRTHLAAERAAAVVAPVLILLPLAMLVLWGLARAISRALEDIGRQAAQQDEHHITELSMQRVPHELRPLVNSFNSLLRRLRDAFTTQRRFVQDAAHELRTPITAIGLQLENLRGDMSCEGARGRYSQLEAGVRRAQRVVDQLLRLSRQEAAGADGVGIVDLQAQLRESINTLIALADQRNIDLGLVGPEQGAAPVTLRCVAGDLRSILDNLIENALRYTPEGGVVDVRVSQDQGKLALEVVDTGPGIPQELLPRVFDRFFRVPGSAANGSGLGLAIAQAAAQRCGLSLTLRNREDRSGLIARVETAA
ncbi:two-component sensor histidine kinase [Ramlibacter sp. G-1-2-2]|uniref:histidine kinase n=1 Tax=Ramlibacter agri TaxID=2728837 RepID=A0A848H5H4_9BURK|nr:ATP-binding protein [Ramlibacter agri]NML42968.1 two-component sensor histidine kinase [Ramlibacter agri]